MSAHRLALVAFLPLALSACSLPNPSTPEPEPADRTQAAPQRAAEPVPQPADPAADEPQPMAQDTPVDPQGTRPANSPAPWAHAHSDLPVDPRVQFFELENGLRVAWAHNPEPKERVYVRLHVDVGSIAETEAERGMAHFLEHMAFNGSENFEAGTLITWFQEHGMSFGADTNAHTSFSETVYKLDLPENSERSVREGLTVLRDFASRLNIAETEVQNEKGVIDGEERERDNPGMRAFVQLLENQYAGTLLPERLPIGTKQARDAFSAQTVRAFYERWYRPETMTLVIVGDVQDLPIEQLAREAFEDMASPGTPVWPEPALGTPSLATPSFLVPEAEIPICQIVVGNLKPFEERADSRAERQRNLTLNVAHAMLELRFNEALKEEGASFLQAQASENGQMRVFEGGQLTVVTQPEAWRAGLTESLHILRGALEFGFQPAELEEVRASLLRDLDEAVERSATADSRELLENLVRAAEEPIVVTDARTERELHGEILRAMTPEDCHRALQAIWQDGTRSLVAMGTIAWPGGVEELTQAVDAAMETELEAPSAAETGEWAYASQAQEFPPVARLTRTKDLDFSQIEFDNGVRLNLKSTAFKERQILIRARLGNGRLDMTEAELAVAQIADEVFLGGGLEAHDADQMRRLLAGRKAGLSFAVKEDAIEINGVTTPDDLLLTLELLCAYLEHPGYRPDSLYAVRKQLPSFYERMQHTVQGPLLFDFLPAVIDGPPKYDWMGMRVPAPLADLLAVDMEAVRKLLQPRLENGALEVTLVGDLIPDEVLHTAGQTLGKLNKRITHEAHEQGVPGLRMQTGRSLTRTIETKIDKATLVLVLPTTDGLEDLRRRYLFFLGQVVNDRMRLEVRERLGAAYSPVAQSQSSRVFQRLGGVFIQADGDPAKVDALQAACREVCRALYEDGITQAEVDRLAEPIQNSLRDMLRTNTYWIDALSRSQADPRTMESARNLIGFYDQIDAGKLSELARRYLNPDRANQLTVLPASSAAPSGSDSDGR